MNDWKGIATIVAIIVGVLTVTVMTQGAREQAEREREAGRAIQRCIRELDTVETRCRAVSPNQCTLNATEFERYQIQLTNQRRLCRSQLKGAK
jgi:type II secretory pathway pseudopilin PulG